MQRPKQSIISALVRLYHIPPFAKKVFDFGIINPLQMGKNKPFISIVMPAYNAQRYIGSSIESVLNQSFKKLELIIVNDASTDKTLDIIRSFAKKDSRIKVVR